MANSDTVVQAIEAARARWDNVAPSLRRLKRYLDLTDAQLAAAVGLSRQTVQNRLAGTTAVSYWELAGFSAFLEVPVDVLMRGPDESVRYVLDHPSPTRTSISERRRRGQTGWFTSAAASAAA